MTLPTSPTRPLLAGLAVTLVAVGVFSWYALRQVSGLRALQTDIVERSRKDSLQLLRIQNNLNNLALAMRDITEGAEPYPIVAFQNEFDRIRRDLNDALRIEKRVTPASRNPAQSGQLEGQMEQFWGSVDAMFQLAGKGNEAAARQRIRAELIPQQGSLSAVVARLLVSNIEAEERAEAEIEAIYRRVERNIYLFLAAMLLAITGISLALIFANRRIFEHVSNLSEQRRTLSRKLITLQEEILHSVSRELHDEFGQILTAIGAMLTRAEKTGIPPDSPLREQLKEVRSVAQETLQKMRALSQALHPTMIHQHGLEKAVAWHVRAFEKQTGIPISYQQTGDVVVIKGDMAIHVYRILQEALNNMARHSGSSEAWVRMHFSRGNLRLEVEDRGIGFSASNLAAEKRGLGLVAMQERASILQGELEISRPSSGGTLVRLELALPTEVTEDAHTGAAR